MRTNEPEPQVQRPLGERVVKPGPAPAAPEWKPLDHNKHVEQGPDGRLRTNLPLP
jgi:hypothetical protein